MRRLFQCDIFPSTKKCYFLALVGRLGAAMKRKTRFCKLSSSSRCRIPAPVSVNRYLGFSMQLVETSKYRRSSADICADFLFVRSATCCCRSVEAARIRSSLSIYKRSNANTPVFREFLASIFCGDNTKLAITEERLFSVEIDLVLYPFSTANSTY